MEGLLLVAILVFAILLRQSIFLIAAIAAAYIHFFLVDSKLEFLLQDVWIAVDREVLLPIPMFILAGAVMTQGKIATRLIRILTELTKPIPGGLALGTLLACAVFGAISGSSVVTMLAIGTVMYPALIKAGYDRTFSVGLIAAAGTLGIIIPPSIAMIIFGIVTETSIVNLFIAGLLPAALLVVLFSAYVVIKYRKMGGSRWNLSDLRTALIEGFPALLLPVILLGGIYSGYFTPTESAVLALVYAVIVERFVYKELQFAGMKKVVSETVFLLGALLPVVAMAGALNTILEFEHIPQAIVSVVSDTIESKWATIGLINMLLLLVGCVMEATSSLIVFSPILLPIAEHHGIDPVHFGIIMILNLEIGFLTPPFGLNIIVATIAFKESFGTVVKGVIPFLVLMILALVIVTLVPALSMALVAWLAPGL